MLCYWKYCTGTDSTRSLPKIFATDWRSRPLHIIVKYCNFTIRRGRCGRIVIPPNMIVSSHCLMYIVCKRLSIVKLNRVFVTKSGSGQFCVDCRAEVPESAFLLEKGSIKSLSDGVGSSQLGISSVLEKHQFLKKC